MSVSTRTWSLHWRRYASCALAVLILTGAAAAPTDTALVARRAGPAGRGAIGLRLLDVPVSERSNPRAALYITDHLAPGTVIHRRIEVSNTTASTAHVLLYAAAATIADGSFLGSAGHTQDDVSMWTSVVPGASDIVAGGNLTAVVTIAVPVDATSGERYGVAWAEVRSPPDGGSGVTEVSRVGIRIYLSIGFGAPPPSNFTIKSLTAERLPDGRPLVVATVRNSGGLALDMSGTLRLSSGPGDLRAGPFPAALGTTLAIGDTEPVRIALDKRVPAGPWDARITLRSGLLERSAHATITFPAAGTSPAVPAATSPDRRAWLTPVISAIVGLLVVAILLLRRRRRRLLRSLRRSSSGDTSEVGTRPARGDRLRARR